MESSLNRFSRRVVGSEEMLVDSNSVYDQDECSLSAVNNFCCGVNLLDAFGLVYLGGVFREDFFYGGGCFFEDVEGIAG